jgi:hypothetical protein
MPDFGATSFWTLRDLPLTNLERGQSWLGLTQEQGPLQVVHLQSGVVVAELPAGARDVRMAVAPGRYLVRRRAAANTYAKEYQVPAGELIRVNEGELELAGDTRLAVKGVNEQDWHANYYLLGGIGTHAGLGLSLAESQYGRVAPQGTPLTGFMAFAVQNTGLGLEVSVPGLLGWRLGKGSAIEWIPWVGLPYYWLPDASGDLRFHFGLGLGLDTWMRTSSRSRVGLNIGNRAGLQCDDTEGGSRPVTCGC